MCNDINELAKGVGKEDIVRRLLILHGSLGPEIGKLIEESMIYISELRLEVAKLKKYGYVGGIKKEESKTRRMA
jgi:hypothetical protein